MREGGLDPRVVGGKAARLGALAEAGFPVPRGFVIPTGALHATLRAAGQDAPVGAIAAAISAGDRTRALELAAAFTPQLRLLPLPRPFRRALAEAHGQLLQGPAVDGGSDGHAPLLAVRSSAVAEDGASRSHAGLYSSVLNLRSLDGVIDAIREVWGSWWAPQALGYLQPQAEGGPSSLVLPSMAVVLQRMVHARASGIVFTVHPARRSGDDVLLEASYGLGEAVSAGRVHVDYHVFTRRGGEIVLQERAIHPKTTELVPLPPGSGRLLEQAVPASRRDGAALSPKEAHGIARWALRAEALFGAPADVEWVIDMDGQPVIVQARPITRRPAGPAPTIAEIRRRPVLWTQRFSGERWSGPVSVLGWSFVQPVLHWFTAWEGVSRRWLQGTEPTRLYRGRPYFNLTIFRFLAFCRLGGRPPDFILEMFPREEQEDLVAAGPYAPDPLVTGSILWQMLREGRWRRYHWDPRTNPTAWDRFEAELEGVVAAIPIPEGDAPAALAELRRGQDLVRAYLRIHLVSLLYAHLSWEALATSLRSWAGESGPRLVESLLAEGDPGHTHNPTLRANHAITELAEAARAEPEIRARLQRRPLPSRAELCALPGGQRFDTRLGLFLEHWGRRGTATWDLMAPRWAEAPELVLVLVAGLVAQPLPPPLRDPSRRAPAERLVLGRMARSWRRRLVPWRQEAFRRALAAARTYSALRERQRFAFDLLMARLHDVALCAGRTLRQRGDLDRDDDVAWLTLDELESATQGPRSPQLRATVARRRLEAEQDGHLPHPDFVQGDDEPLTTTPTGALLRGLGISQGRGRGRVRVLHTLQDGDALRPGEVLVARSVDPAWTPLFLHASGLVLELGSVLSHGAVIAREYGLPAVVNVEGASTLLRDGEEVTIDGDRGLVLRHRAP